ncbi:MAG: HAD hydrolase-like protein [Deltaproteobacteria bacterium]|nr:HAD hydrolase-like protein [Deltaproteobacteria bacterium]
MAPASKIKAVVFDCDGVMFDSTEANTAFYNAILAHMGKSPMTPEQFNFAHMATADQTMENLFPDPDELFRAQALRRKIGYSRFIGLMRIEPTLMELLSIIRPDYYTAIATNRSDTMNRVLSEHGLDGSFDFVVTSLHVPRPKPFPDPIEKVLDHFGLGPERAIYIGDTEMDELASHAARVPFVAYRNPVLVADFHVESLIGVKDILNHLG